MNTKKYFTIVTLLIVLFSSCKKNDTPKTNSPTVGANGAVNISDADGALYAIQTTAYDTYNSPTFELAQIATAWFGKYPAIVYAGAVNINGNPLDTALHLYSLDTFLSSDTIFSSSTLSGKWSVTGNSANGIAPFAYTDNTPAPVNPNFQLPASVSINSNLTVTHTPTGGALGVLYQLIGDKGDTTKFVANTSSSITFTASEVKSVAVSGGALGLSIVPITYSSTVFGGKKYYFIKENEFNRYTTVN